MPYALCLLFLHTKRARNKRRSGRLCQNTCHARFHCPTEASRAMAAMAAMAVMAITLSSPSSLSSLHGHRRPTLGGGGAAGGWGLAVHRQYLLRQHRDRPPAPPPGGPSPRPTGRRSTPGSTREPGVPCPTRVLVAAACCLVVLVLPSVPCGCCRLLVVPRGAGGVGRG